MYEDLFFLNKHDLMHKTIDFEGEERIKDNTIKRIHKEKSKFCFVISFLLSNTYKKEETKRE